MFRRGLIALILLAIPGFTAAQRHSPSTDALGAHLNGGRGCNACHSGHSSAYSNGGAADADNSGGGALWGQDVTGLYGKTISTGGGKFVEVLPASASASTPDVKGLLACLSCHDGNMAAAAHMRNKIYESLPATYGRYEDIPTVLGTAESNYLGQHPVGLTVAVKCGGPANWDCTESNGEVTMNGPNSSRFVRNYGFFVSLAAYNNGTVVMCTTCHDPHSMTAVNITSASNTGLPPGTYRTSFFLRAPYDPYNTNPNSNTTSQFCRQCHADKSNEMNGSTAGTIL